MRLRHLSLLAAICLPVPTAWAQDPCDAAADVAERAYAVPPGLLAAIGRVESGRWNPAAGRTAAWPWTFNVAGIGSYATDQAAAVATVTALQAKGSRSIDIGCFQVNLLHHPKAFPTVAAGFDPAVNADYAARFLSSLRGKLPGWPEAVAAYHSADPNLGGPYWSRVSAAWGGAPAAAARPAVIQAVAVRSTGSVKVWTPVASGSAPSWIRIGGGALPHVATLLSGGPNYESR